MTAHLIDDKPGGAALDGLSQRFIGGIGNIIQAAQNGAGGRSRVGGLIQCVPACCLQRLCALELSHHVFLGEVLLAGTGTAFVEGGDHVADIGIGLTNHADAGNGHLRRRAAPVAAQDDGGFHPGVEIRLCLIGKDLIGAQLALAQTVGSQRIRRLPDLVGGELLAEGIIEDIDLQIVQCEQAGIHIDGRGGILGALGVADHTDSGLIHIV